MKKNSFWILLLIFLIFWQLWTPGPKVATDYPYWYKQALDTFLSFPYVWRELFASGMGESVVDTIWIYPELLIFGLFSNLGLSFTAISLLFLILPLLVLSLLSINMLLSYLKINGWGRWLGSFLFMTNSYFIMLLDGGQLNLAMAFALIPLIFTYYRKIIEEFSHQSLLKFILSIILCSIFDIRVIYILVILIFVDFLFESYFNWPLGKTEFLNFVKVGLLAVLALVGFHSYWILPSILTESTFLPSTYNRSDQVNFLSFSSLGHGFLLLHPNFHENIFGKITTFKAEFTLLPILTFLSLLFKRNRWIGYWLTISLVGIFLSKGSQPPFGQLYLWAFDHIPGFVFFRDPSKFFILIALSYSLLIGYSIQSLLQISKGWIFGKLRRMVPLIIFVMLIFMIRPVFLDSMTGLLSQPRFINEYQSLSNYLKEDEEFSRVLWIPTRPPLGYSGPNHPSVESLYLITERPFAISSIGTYEALNFLRESPFMGEILDISGIGYIAYPMLDPLRADPHPDNVDYYKRFLAQLSVLPWVEEVIDKSSVPLLKLKNHQHRFFIAENSWFIVGSDRIYLEATKSANFSLSKNAFIFAEEKPNLGGKLDSLPLPKIVLANRTIFDLAAIFINNKDMIFPAQKINFHPAENGWWKRESADLLWLKEFLKTKYEIDFQEFDFGGGWAIAEGNLNLNINNKKFKTDRILLARLIESSKSGTIKFNQGSKQIGEVKTKTQQTNVRWFEVGSIPNNTSINIATEGEINVINALAVLDKDVWDQFQEKANSLDAGQTTQEFRVREEVEGPTVNYEQINPTKYKIKISGLDEPKMLIFSQKFDPNWQMSSMSSIPVYSWLNGFTIEKDGEYIVEYGPQKYVYIGLLVSGLTLVVLLGFLWKYKKLK